MELVELFLDSLKIDEKITAFCIEKYGKAPVFFVGMDINQPPAEDDCPYILLAPTEKQEGLREMLRYSVSIAWSVANKEIKQEDNVIRFAGTAESDELGQLILRATSKALNNSVIHDVNYMIDTITQYPQFPGEVGLIVAIPNAIGGEIEF